MVKKRTTKRKPKEPVEQPSSAPEESAASESDEAASSAQEDEPVDAVFDGKDAAKDESDDEVVDAKFDGGEAQAARTVEATEGDEAPGARAATQLGGARYVIFGFFAAWLTGSYVLHKVVQGVWGSLAHRDWFSRALPSLAAVPHEGELVSRESISVVLGAILAAVIVYVYYRKPDVRQWADEVAEQLAKVKWPTRKDVGNNTLVVIAVGAVLTVYLAILDRFWSFVTNLIYSSGM